MDAAVAKVAIICVTILAIVAIAGVVLVAVLGSDVVGVSAAIGVTLAALGKLLVSFRKNAKTGDTA